MLGQPSGLLAKGRLPFFGHAGFGPIGQSGRPMAGPPVGGPGRCRRPGRRGNWKPRPVPAAGGRMRAPVAQPPLPGKMGWGRREVRGPGAQAAGPPPMTLVARGACGALGHSESGLSETGRLPCDSFYDGKNIVQALENTVHQVGIYQKRARIRSPFPFVSASFQT